MEKDEKGGFVLIIMIIIIMFRVRLTLERIANFHHARFNWSRTHDDDKDPKWRTI